jgi:hypothetical protein
MTDKFKKQIKPRDIVMYTGYGTDWKFGMVAKVTDKSVVVFEGMFEYEYGGKKHQSYYDQRKNSSNHLLILEGDQVEYAIQNFRPFQRPGSVPHKLLPKDYTEFLKEYDEYLKYKGWDV